MQKVGFWSEAGKSFLMIKARAGFFGVYALVFFLYGLMSQFLGGDFDPENPEWGGVWMNFLLGMTVGPALYLSLLHFTMGSCRNETSFFPENRVGAWFRFLLTSIAVSAISGVFGLLGSVPLFVVSVSGMSGNPETAILAIILAIVFFLLSLLCFLVPFMRFSFVLPAVAIGDEYTFSKAWRMTKGYTVKLLVTALLCLGAIAAVVFVGWVITDLDAEIILTSSLFGAVFNAVFMVWGTVYCCLLYEQFRIRYEAGDALERVVEAHDQLAVEKEASDAD